MAHQLASLPYSYDALEPVIDEQTMKIHHTKHHQGYVNNLNAALEGLDELAALSVEDLLRNINKVPSDKKQVVINNGGGHANHSLFWKILRPVNVASAERSAQFQAAQDSVFGSYESFEEKFVHAATTRFGSGWAWLVVDSKGNLQVYSTANQDSPLMDGHTPILGIDVWEHAYYLKYQNRRADYVKNFMGIIDWSVVSKFYQAAVSGQ